MGSNFKILPNQCAMLEYAMLGLNNLTHTCRLKMRAISPRIKKQNSKLMMERTK